MQGLICFFLPIVHKPPAGGFPLRYPDFRRSEFKLPVKRVCLPGIEPDPPKAACPGLLQNMMKDLFGYTLSLEFLQHKEVREPRERIIIGDC